MNKFELKLSHLSALVSDVDPEKQDRIESALADLRKEASKFKYKFEGMSNEEIKLVFESRADAYSDSGTGVELAMTANRFLKFIKDLDL